MTCEKARFTHLTHPDRLKRLHTHTLFFVYNTFVKLSFINQQEASIMSPLEQRALSAYFRHSDGMGQPVQPSDPDTVEIDGKRYIVLSNTHGTLAVYRVRTVNGKDALKRLKRYPEELQ